jgi:CRP/FNR family transcriptional regulator
VLGRDDLAEYKSRGGNVRLAAGQPLFHEGAPANRVFTLTKGMMKLYKLLPDGRRQVTGFMHPGDLLGVSIDGEHAFTAEALEPTELCSFGQSRFDDFVETHSDMERELYRVAVHELAAARDQMVLLGRKTAMERLASFFVSLAERRERGAAQHERFIELPMSRSDIADYLGLTKETVSRVLAILKRTGIIRLDALDRIEILNRVALRAMAAGDSGR